MLQVPAACKAMVEARHKGNNAFIQGVNNYRATRCRTSRTTSMGGLFAPEVGYFGEQWKTSVDNAPCIRRLLNDFVVYNSDQVADSRDRRLVLDNIRPREPAPISSRRGYKLPDGRVQPSFRMFATRTFWLRARAASAEHGKPTRSCCT